MGSESDTKRSKVARLIGEYGLDGLGDELEERWTRSEDRSSLRDLADYFNRQLLESALESIDTDPLQGGVDNVYRLLTDDDVTSGVRQETRSRLEQRGVDVESLENDFVSYQAIRTYLKEYRDTSSPDTSVDPDTHRQRKRTTIQQLTSRLTTVTEEALGELKNADRLALGEFNVLVAVRVHCLDCDSRVSIPELIRNGGCDCEA
jgi:hypothetical protein